MGNKNAKGTIGNKGGGRMGYTYERDQLVRLRKVVDRGIYLIEAIMKGRVSEKEMEKYKLIQPALLKAFDKLHPNKQESNILPTVILPVPILTNVFGNDINKKNSFIEAENQSSTGGDGGIQDSINPALPDSSGTV